LFITSFVVAFCLPCGHCEEQHVETRNEAFLANSGDGLEGYVLTTGNSTLRDQAIVKEHLVHLLKSHDSTLQQLHVRHVQTRPEDADGFFRSVLIKRYELAPGPVRTFVPQRIRIHFSVALNSSRHVSQKALHEVQRGLADPKFIVHAARRELAQDAACPKKEEVEAHCKTKCEAYTFRFCSNCDCSSNEGTPQCSCLLDRIFFINVMLSNTYYAAMMLIFGLIIRRYVAKTEYAIQKVPMKHQTHLQWDVTPDGDGNFDSISNCLGDTNVCCVGCCCPAIRLAMTYYYSQHTPYLKSLILFCILFAIPGRLAVEIILPIVLVIFRRRIRKYSNMQTDLFTDCLCACCCSLCFICQDARFVDNAVNRQLQQYKAEAEEKQAIVGVPVAVADPNATQATANSAKE
jgi:Cys-rich protein (TIGR01571 family)